MGSGVKLFDIVDALEMVGPGQTSYLNRVTGETVCLSDDEVEAAEAGDEVESEQLPDWERELREQAQAILASEDWVALPDSFDIHEYSIMQDFAASQVGSM